MPAWTEVMYPPSSGIDPLGLASVSQDRILPALALGINVLTRHPRYWSFYIWMLTEFWDRDLPRTRAAWGRFLKPRERIYVAAVLSCPRHGTNISNVIGQRRVGKEVAEGASEFDPNAFYFKAPQGGYGIYVATIAQVGLSVQGSATGQFQCDAPTENGRNLGMVVRDWVKDSTYYTDYFDDSDGPVPSNVVEAYSELLCLCRLPEGPDCPILADAFLHGGDTDAATARRASLRMICDIADQTGIDPADTTSGWTFRQLVYYRSSDALAYEPHDEALLHTARRWRLYQHREQAAWALNRWMRYIWRWGLDQGGDQRDLPFDEVLGTVENADFSDLAARLETADPGLTSSSPLTALFDWARTGAAVSGEIDDPWDLDAGLTEDAVLDVMWDLDDSGDFVVAGILTLLVLSAARIWERGLPLRYASDWRLVRAGGNHRLSCDRQVRDLRRMVEAGWTIGEAGSWLLEHYVIRQHHRVSLGKLPDDTFRLRLEGGAVRFVDQSFAVEMNDSRYRSLATVATECGWISVDPDAGAKLTLKGQQLVDGSDLDLASGGA